MTLAPASAAGTVDVTVTTYVGTSATSSADLFTYPGTPTVSSLSASSGSSAGGTAITITGTGFTGTQIVYFGDTILSDFTVNSDTSLSVISPPSDAGTVDVLVQGPNGISAPSSSTRFSFTAASAPAVSSLSTSSGSTPGGTVVSVTGSGFTGATQVMFGEVAAQAYVNSDTQLTAVSPAQPAATVDVTVLTPTGTSAVSSADHFTYSAGAVPSVTSLSITSGGTGGGTVVTILGSGFTDAVSVQFGSVQITDFNVLNDSTIVATSPEQAAGTVDVTVTNNAGTSSTSSADHFTYSAAAAPSVTSITPTSGPATGGSTVTVVGSGFTGATDVEFGDIDAVWFSVLSDSVIQAATGGGSGTVHTVVTTPSGSSSTGSGDQFSYTSVSAPSITSLSASSGSTAGGLLLMITGSGFTTATDVYFGGIDVTDFVINSDSQISVLTPASTSGTYDIQVVSVAGSSALSSADRFTYNLASAPSVSSIGTSSGTTAGGTSVAVSGSHFTAATQVLFGSTSAASFTVNSDTSITAISPPLPAGTVDILVQTPSGTSAAVSADQFTYSVGTSPSVTSLGTTGGSTGGGTSVTILGSHFTGAIGVNFGSVAAAYFTVVSDTAIVASSPSQAAGTVHVTVSINGATSSTSSADQFTYTAASAPTVSTLSPNSGPTNAGQPVLVTGSHFSGATQVAFGGVAASFQINSDNSITAYAPFMAAGSYVVQVTTPSGLSSSGGPQYTYNNVTASAPAITGVSPNTGNTGGGQIVTITGTNFSGTTAVKFGTTSATSFQIVSDTQITATAPSHAAGMVHTQVTTNNGSSSAVTADEFTYGSTAVPTVTGLSPSTRTTAGGSVTVTGTGFTGATALNFGSVPGTIGVINPTGTGMTATAPAQAVGTVNVTVTTPAGTSATGSGNFFIYTLGSLPTVTSLGTSSGSSAGGTSVAITGTNFGGVTGVSFGGVAAASFTVNSSTSITAVSPAQAAGPVNVQVTTYNGTSAPSAQFTYTTALVPAVTSLGTSTGTTAGGTSVAVNGSNFTGATGVMFGTVPAASFTVNSNTSITAVSPPAPTGTVDVIVQSASGTSQTSSSDHFTCTAASVPSVSSLGTTSGTTGGGTSVAVNGSHFTGATAVSFGTVPAAGFTVNSDTSITAVSPPQAASIVDVRVTTYAGTSSTSSSDRFTYTAASAPSVTGLSPASGSILGGDTITILGSAFTGASAVSFGSVSATFSVISDNAIVAYAPSASATGNVYVQVTTPSGTSSTGSSSQYTYTSVSSPSVTSLSASSGSSAGGTAVTITGSGLSNASAVSFGSVAAASFLVVNDTTVQCTSPSQAAGAVDVTVTANGTTSALSSADQFTYTAASAPSVTSLGTSSGSTAGGTSVAVNGSGFTGATDVSFGGTDAASFIVNSDTSITAVSPALAAGTVDVVVTTPTGTSQVSSSDQFTFTAGTAPSVTGLSLNSGSTAGGTLTSITGSGFTGVTAVNFGTVSAGFTFQDDGWITATAPPQAAATVHVTVVTTSGTSSTSSADQFTYSAASAPAVTAVSPSSGSTAGGVQVIVIGSGFTGASAVNFGTVAADFFSVLSDTTLQAYAPGQTAGTVDITVTTPSGTSSTSSADQYTYTADSVPTVTGLNVSSGLTAGGNVVIVTGTNFTDVSDVEFGVYSAATYYVNSATQISVVVPSQFAGTVDVTVTNPAGTSATSSSDQYTYSNGSVPTVTGVSPTSGPAAGGNYVTVTGTNFLGTYQVSFGSTAVDSFTILSSTTIVVTAPAGTGTVDITVTNFDGTSATSSSDRYTYV